MAGNDRSAFFHDAVIQLFVGLHCVDRRPMLVEDEAEEAVRLAGLLTDKLFPEKGRKSA